MSSVLHPYTDTGHKTQDTGRRLMSVILRPKSFVLNPASSLGTKPLYQPKEHFHDASKFID